jgi:hypothetical protein
MHRSTELGGGWKLLYVHIGQARFREPTHPFLMDTKDTNSSFLMDTKDTNSSFLYVHIGQV